MKAWLLVPVLLIGGVLAAKGSMTTHKSETQVFDEARAWAVKTFALTEIGCPYPSSRGKPNVRCYGTKDDQETFVAKVDGHLGKELGEITGWRLDYGVASAGFVFSGQRAWDFGVIHKGRDREWDFDMDTWDPIKKAGYQGVVTLTIGAND